MAYQNNIPQPTDVKSKSQGDILGNFAALTSWGNGYGNFTDKGVAPVPLLTDMYVWNALNAVTGKQELYVNRSGETAVPFTTYKKDVFALSNQAYTQLPSGVIIKWGDISTTVLGTNTVTFNPAYPAFTSAYQVIVNTQRGGAATDPNQALYSSVTGLTAFNVYCYLRTGTGTITNVPFSWIAIGV